jgi:RNA polymerase sigma-70 factor (ECF subfamily)
VDQTDVSTDEQDLHDALVALQPRLRRFAYGLTGTRADADDLVQATYERALSRLNQWRRGSRLDSWMFRVMHSIRINAANMEKNRANLLRAEQANFSVIVDGARDNEARLTLSAVREFIWRLPEEQREALLMVAVEGMSYKETAEILDLPIGTVTSRIARARIALTAFVEGSDQSASAHTIARES